MPRPAGRVIIVALIAAMVTFVALASASASRARRQVTLALSAQDPDLVRAITALSPEISRDEAARIAHCAYTTGRELRREWNVAWPPGLQNFLVHNGKRKGGLCFQYAEELLVRLHLLNFQTVKLHWAEAYQRTPSEHNVVVITGKAQDFAEGVLLDNWRYGGRLAWGWVRRDPEYRWSENPQHYHFVLNEKFRARTQPAKTTAPTG